MAGQGGMHGRGCMAGGHGMCGGGHVWQGACTVGGVRDGGHAWQGDMRGRGKCMAGGHAWHAHPSPADTMRYGQ